MKMANTKLLGFVFGEFLIKKENNLWKKEHKVRALINGLPIF